MREELTNALKEAMKARDARRVSTIRMVQSAIKDLDIASRTTAKGSADDGDIATLLAKLVKSREESAKIYDDANRPELAAQEREEIAIITEFMPRQLSEAEVGELVAGVIAELGASSVKDMGRVMAVLKERHAGQMDFGKASGLVKARLS